MHTESMLTRREATLRSAATMCLAGIALVQAIELPSLLAQGGQFAVLALAAMGVCVGLGLALAATPVRVARQVWGVVAAIGVLVFAGWAALRLFIVPGLSHHQGHWAGMPGALVAGLGVSCVVLAAIAVPPTRAAVRALATATGVLLALAPGAGMVLAAFGPGLSGGETALSAGVQHHHAHSGLDETQITFQALPGGHGGHFVYKATATPHQTALGVALMIIAALVFIYGAVGYLRRRSAPGASSMDFSNLEGGLA
ncbi:MAG: hypothetical protein ACJ782_23535 [Actinomycetota bacterium]